MTRRNLSDILRQEVKKEAPEAAEPESQPVEAEKVAAAAATSSNRARKSSAASTGVAQPNDASEAKFTAQITELKAALAQGAEHEKNLQAEIKSLLADAKRQQKEVSNLESQMSRLKTELTEAKDVILQLSEENTQMNKTLSELKTPKAQPQRKAPLSLRSLPSHSVQPSSQASSANKAKSVDVGWMD